MEVGGFFYMTVTGCSASTRLGALIAYLVSLRVVGTKSYFFPNRYYLWKCVKTKIKAIQLQHLSRNINHFIAI